MDSWQVTLIILLAMLLLNYIAVKFLITSEIPTHITDTNEAFTTREGFAGDTSVDIQEFNNDTLYDSFYSKIYDQIVQGDVRVRAEVLYTMGWLKKFRPEVKTVEVLDIGCGTGTHVAEFLKEGVGKAVGVDRSSAMIERANTLYPQGTFKVADADQPRTFAAGQFTLATMYYFTVYYIHHKDQILRNVFNWLQPGGAFVVHIVNREKFDPILESASPFMAFSVQKYSKERITRSKVAFDKFDYAAEFTNEEHDANFTEIFKFKDGRVRKNVHRLHMPAMEKIVHEIEQAGFTFKEFLDLTPIGYEYQYLFCFMR
jgi:ubiquinone/menaquinone biosynthesis C-methylase UbiE